MFPAHGLEYALWGHETDGNMHPNVVPRSLADVHLGSACSICATARPGIV